MKTIREKIAEMPAGRFFRVNYATELPLKAKYKNQGMVIRKYTTITTRTGVKYSNIEGVIPSENNKPSYYEWVIKNKIKRNINNNKEYVQFAPITKGSNRITKYWVYSPEGTENIKDIGEYVIPSYFTKKDAPKVITVKLDNILWVG